MKPTISPKKAFLLILVFVTAMFVTKSIQAKEKISVLVEQSIISGGSKNEHFIQLRLMATKIGKTYTLYFTVDGVPTSQEMEGNRVLNLKFKDEVVIQGCDNGRKCELRTVSNGYKKEVKVKKDTDSKGNRVFRIVPK